MVCPPRFATVAISPELGELLSITGLSNMTERPISHDVLERSTDPARFEAFAREHGYRLLHTRNGVMLEPTPANAGAF